MTTSDRVSFLKNSAPCSWSIEYHHSKHSCKIRHQLCNVDTIKLAKQVEGKDTHIALLTFDIQVERIALTVALRVTGEASVQARDVPANRLQHECLVAQDDACTRVVVKWLSLYKQ